MDDRSIVETALRQHGLITLDQAIRAGGTPRSVEALAVSGRWRRTREGVYVVGAALPTWEQQVMAACLAAGPDAVASHRTAARLHGLVDRSGPLELLTDGYRRVRIPGVLTHRTIHMIDADKTTVAGIPVTSVVRTLIDASPRQPTATVGRWVDLALLRHQLDLGDLAERTSELTMRGRPRPISLMKALTLRSPGHDPGRSVFEARVIEAAGRHGLPPLARQHPVTRPDGRQAFIDLAHPPSMVAIELDGWETHGVREAFEPDRIRGNELLLLGWSLLRFTWRMPDLYICTTIGTAIDLNLSCSSVSGHEPTPEVAR